MSNARIWTETETCGDGARGQVERGGGWTLCRGVPGVRPGHPALPIQHPSGTYWEQSWGPAIHVGNLDGPDLAVMGIQGVSQRVEDLY